MRRSPDPSVRMTYCWSQVRPSRVDWNVSQRPSRLKYASAFSPPFVRRRMFVRCDSPGSALIAAAPPPLPDAAAVGVGDAFDAEWHPDAKAATTRVVAAYIA